jgi:hypothetical protein
MITTSRLPVSIAAGLLWLIATPHSKADTIYQVSATLVANGNANCPSCSDVIPLNFQVDTSISYQDPTSPSLEISFSNSAPGFTIDFNSGNEILGHFQFGSFPGDEIDVSWDEQLEGGKPVFELDGAFFYSCQTAACVQDFTLNDMPCVNLSCMTVPVNIVDYSVTPLNQVPEVPSRALILYGGLFTLMLSLLPRVLRREKVRGNLSFCAP